jgi:hypothetical protein
MQQRTRHTASTAGCAVCMQEGAALRRRGFVGVCLRMMCLLRSSSSAGRRRRCAAGGAMRLSCGGG